jgi:hypothetical protein
MNEVAINLEGVVIDVELSRTQIQMTKGTQFDIELASTVGVIVDDKVITLGEAHRKWMHDKLDAWIDGGKE